MIDSNKKDFKLLSEFPLLERGSNGTVCLSIRSSRRLFDLLEINSSTIRNAKIRVYDCVDLVLVIGIAYCDIQFHDL